MAYQDAKKVLFAKVESTPGTPETLTETEFNTVIYNPVLKPIIEFENDVRVALNDHSEMEDYSGAESGELKFTTKLHNAGAVNTIPNYAKFFQGCGVRVQAEGTDKGVSFNPMAAYDKVTLTIWYVIVEAGASPKALIFKYAGCSGDCVVKTAGVGKTFDCEFTFKGKKVSHDDVADASTISDMTSANVQIPYINTNTTYTFGSLAELVSSFELSFGNDVQPIIDTADSTSTSYAQFYVAGRKPRLKINPLIKTKAVKDYLGMVKGNTCEKVTIANASAIPIKFTFPKAQGLTPDMVAREGLIAWDANYKLLRNGQVGSLVVSDMPVECPWEILIGAKS